LDNLLSSRKVLFDLPFEGVASDQTKTVKYLPKQIPKKENAILTIRVLLIIG
jgi:hypothetical protein